MTRPMYRIATVLLGAALALTSASAAAASTATATASTATASTGTAGPIAAGAAAGSPVAAGQVAPGDRCVVDSDGIFVPMYQSPGGAQVAAVPDGTTFQVAQVSGAWAYGFAYGSVNRYGWIQTFYLTDCVHG